MAFQSHNPAEVGEAYPKPQPIPGLSARIIYEAIGPIFSVQPWNLPSYA
jgi:acyl-CoA reductase-like NAD-dependent aldehyde dehydrogenase